MTKVMIAIPTDGEIHHTVVGVLAQILLNEKRFKLDTYISQMAGIGEHRNRIVKDFLQTDNDFLVMIDSDNPPTNDFLDLVEHNLDIVGLPTPINMSYIQGIPDIRWNVFDENDLPIKFMGHGLEEVKMVGTGCIIIARRVLEAIEHPFTTVRDLDDMRTVGTDTAFCRKAKEKGFSVWTHWDYKCGHFKDTNLLNFV
jgi:hypothetical protein